MDLAGLAAKLGVPVGERITCPVHNRKCVTLEERDGEGVLTSLCGCESGALLAALGVSNGNGKPKQQHQRPNPEAAASDDILRRVPPQDIDAEESVLGSIFLDNDVLPHVRQIVKATDFYREGHRILFATILQLADQNVPIDAITVTAALRRADELNDVGAGLIAMCAARVPTSVNAEHYARIVRDMAVKRNVAKAATKLAQLAYDGVSVDGLVGEADRMLVPYLSGGTAVALYEDRHAIDAFEAHQIMVSDQREYSWEGFIKEGCTMIISGLMGSGKSTFGMNLARAWFFAETFLERRAKQSRTLVVVSPKEYEAWADTIGFWRIQGGVFLVESTKAHFGKPEQQVAWFHQEMERLGCRTFILDTLFDFFGTPPNTAGDENRKVMNEQTPFLQMVRERMYSGLVLGHPPKSEAYTQTPRDPEESFGGHTAWTAQHRMRGTIRRNMNANAFITGKGGYGDQAIMQEHMLLFDEQNRIVTLGGLFKDYLGVVAMPSVIEAISGWVTRSDIEKKVNKRKEWILAGLKEALKQGRVKHNGKGSRSRKYALAEEPEQDDLFG